MRDALTMTVVRFSRQHGLPLLCVRQQLRLKAGADLFQRVNELGHFVGPDPPVHYEYTSLAACVSDSQVLDARVSIPKVYSRTACWVFVVEKVFSRNWQKQGRGKQHSTLVHKNYLALCDSPAVRVSLSALTSTRSFSSRGRSEKLITTNAAQNSNPTTITRRWVGLSAL
jgi:hypothetical protein